MTLLNWFMDPDQVLLLSDTLSLQASDKRPKSFMTKVFTTPHIGALITGTGSIEVVTRFYLHVISGMIVEDVVQLSNFAPESLRAIWQDVADQMPAGATTTVYTFGLTDEGFVGFAYRSTSNFEAEEIQHGTAAKPAPEIAKLGAIYSLQDFVALAREQQADDRALPRLDRVGIGGDLWMYRMTKSESGMFSLKVEHLEQLAHYDDDHSVMLARLPQNEGHPDSTAILQLDP